ncbi:NINE protein [Undibacterium sp. Ren11W]|uniref:NINE protein n=1 Tax=Undibacterium sp. Ren11W TaxID=3413045 RepID=UPI003BF154ED
MQKKHKNKAITSFLASILGSIGVHRFYLAGANDKWGWLHLASLPLSLILSRHFFNLPLLATMSPFVLSFLASILEALVLGLIADEKWDAKYNLNSGQQSDTSWPLALSLVLTVGLGAMALIAVLARSFDLLYTGGAYG